jgi:nitroreductase
MKPDDIFNLIVDRRSIRSFDPRPVELEKINRIFECARWAPSSYNRQPWRFIFATSDQKENYSLLFDLINESNKNWVYQVPLLILTVSEVFMQDRLSENKFASHDTGMAVANLYIMARAMGLEFHPMGGYDKEKAKTVLHIPVGFEPMAMLAIGYSKPHQEFGDEIQEYNIKPRMRKDFTEIVMNGNWFK